MTSSPPTGSAETAAGQPLSVFADLRLETAGQRVQLVGDGQSLVLHTDHPRALLTAVNHASLPSGNGVRSGRRALGRTATALARSGLRVDVRGPDGVLISLGDGAGSRTGALLTGSEAVEFGPARTVAGALTAGVPLRRITAFTLLLGCAAGVLALRRRRT